MDKEIQKSMDDLLADYNFESFEPVSFVSGKNINIDSVQFVMTTPEIKIKTYTESETLPKEPEGIWERFLALFK
ncbi:hypothetical protein [Kineothrix alysoides]|nr:hypothetical protein [Kineothrix alysoides]